MDYREVYHPTTFANLAKLQNTYWSLAAVTRGGNGLIVVHKNHIGF